MNKVFKVIWNEARNAYVVVSEIAKNRGSKSCSTKKLLAMLIATGVMTCASFDVLAEEPTAAETAQFQYVAFYDETSDLINGQDKLFGGHKYIYDATNKYWVREGYVLVVEKNGKLHTPLSANGKSADVLYTGGGDTGSILQSVASTVSANGTVTNMGESLNRITASAFAGVSHGGGTAVAGDWAYIIQDSSWKDSVAPENYKDGYADLIDKDNGMPKGFKTAEDPNTELNWDATKQAYTYKGKPVDYSNVYVINGKIGVFTNKDGSEVYKGTVFGKNNEILMTVKDANNHFYSYWASEVTDPSATMQSYRMTEYKKDLSVLEENDNKLHRDDIKEVTMTTDASINSAIIGLVRNGNTEAGASVKGAITVTSGGGTGGQDTFVKISNDTANQTFATGSKVEAIGTNDATTGIKINGQEYTIKDNDTQYTAGDNVAIDTNNKISVDLSQYAKTVDVAVVYNDKNSLYSTNSGKVGEKAIALGQKAIADGKFSVAIGDSANVDANSVYTSSGAYSTAVGAASGAWGVQATAVGYNAKAKGRNAVALGFSASASATDSVAIGASSIATREAGFLGLYADGKTDSTWKATSGAVSIGKSGTTRQIINLAAGTNDTDAVNVAQLKKVKAEADKHTTLVAGANVTLNEEKTENGLKYTISATGTNYTAGNGIAIDATNNTISVKLQADSNLEVSEQGLALKKQLIGMESIQGAGEGKISFDGANVKVNNTTFSENSVVVGGGTDGKTPVTINGTDGVVSGLHNTNIGYTDFATKGNAATEEQLKKVMDAGWKFTTDSGIQTTVTVGEAGNEVKFNGDNANIDVTNTGNNIKVALNKKLTVDSVKADKFFMDNTQGVGYDGKAYITSSGLNANNQKITGVADGTDDTDAVNVGQLKTVSEVANQGWKLSTNGDAASKVAPGKIVDFSGDKNISVSHNGTKVKVELNDELENIKSISNGDSRINLNADSISISNGNKSFAITNSGIGMSYITADYSAKSIMLGENGTTISGGLNVAGSKITGVAAGTIAAGSTDAVNGSQLNDIKNSINTDISNKTFGLKDDKGSEVTSTLGNTVQVKGADGITSTVKDGALEIGLKLQEGSNLVVNSNGLALNTALTGIQSITGAGAGSISFADGGNVKVNQNTFNSDGRIQNVANGTETNDAVNFGQLKETNTKIDNLTTEVGKGWTVATENGTATKVGAGDTVKFNGDDNIKVSNIGKDVKVELNKELTVDSVKAGDFFMDKNEGVGYKGKAYITSSGLNANGQTITNVKAGEAETDAVNVGQLNAVKAEASKKTTLSNGKNTTVTSVTTDGQTDYKVNVAGDLKDITSVANGASEIKLNADSIIIANTNKTFAITNSGIGMSYVASDYSTKAIMLGENGTTISGGLDVAGSKIIGVAAGEANTDAVNVGQLNTVKNELQTSDKQLVTNPASTDGSYKPDANGNISLRVEDQNKNGYNVVIKDVASKAELSEVANRVTNVENKVTQIETDVTNIKNDITNIQTDVTDIKTDITNINNRVDKVEALAGKHTTLENGTNINVEETLVDGHKNYKVNLNKDITLGDENGNKVSISGTNGTITATNRINADKGGKLADIDVTDNKLSNGDSSITLDGTNVKVNDKVTVDKDGKISGVAKGDISNTSTDAVNGSQLYDTNTHITNVENQVVNNTNRINKLGSRVNKVGAGAAALAALHPMDFDPDDKLTFSAGYGNYAGENAAAIGAYYRPDEKVMFSVAGTIGNGENMVNAGVSFALDRTNHVSNSRTALAREVIDLRGQLAVMGAKMAKMEKAFGMLDETKTKLFPDIPANHWAYEYIAKLAGNGYIEGYPDGNFGGDRLMTRYEFAAMLYRAIENGAALEEKIIKEFEPELGRIRVERISGEDGDRNKIERVRVNATKGERDHYGNKLAK